MGARVQPFRERMRYKQVVYKTEVLGINQMGRWRGEYHPHILPEDYWSLNLWDEISYKAIRYFAQSEIEWHEQKHNLLSSQIMCVNVFFPLKLHLDVLKPWLSSHFSNVGNVVDLDFEYIAPKDYLNEGEGRNQNRTRSDISIIWEDREKNKNLLLLEFKFTERNFGECNQRKNPNPTRCLSSRRVVASPSTECHLVRDEGRRYWSRTRFADIPFLRDALTTELYCPFRYDFFQLMRSQLMAYRIRADFRSGFDKAEFGVIYHADNDELVRMARPFGEERNPLKAWPTLLKSPETFHAFSVQELLDTVEAGLPADLQGWRTYLKERYGL